MVIIPREKPVIENLNVYYLDIRKLFEHFQGEIGSGGVFFKSHSAEGAIFFDEDELLNGYFQEKDIMLTGNAAIDQLVQAESDQNYSVSIYKISQEEVYFWASLPSAEIIYKDLSTDFTNLEGLIKKMSSEKLTGYIDVSIGDGIENGLVFISNGEIIGGSYSWGGGGNKSSQNNLKILIDKTKKSGGIFNVSRIPMKREKVAGESKEQVSDTNLETLAMIEEFLVVFETLVPSGKNKGTGFSGILKKKFVEKAEEYAFLDPFAAEFEYSDRKIKYSGQAGEKELADGVITSVKELAEELGILTEMKKYLAPWTDKYEKKIEELGVVF
ncbi:MAG: hypothetical protein B6I30_01225 [Desulfobacteraceae bacterium 4572_187]|nr:MAG: hypothetical protein B6I30_01225 [Desulfobacteraceae bacterium 4572_187]